MADSKASSESYERIRVEVVEDAALCRITLNRPDKRNALDPLTIDELTDALAWADADDRVKVILLSGAGRDFCSGIDLAALQEIAAGSAEENLADADALADLFLVMRRLARPIVAAVRGHALAGGCGLATACDIVLASDDAKFGYPEVSVGFVPAMVMALLRRCVGEKVAFELVATGRVLGAGEAHRLGLVHHVYPAAEFDARVEGYAAGLAEKGATPLALCKRLLYETDAVSFEAAIRAGAQVNALARHTEDFRAGLARFLARKGTGKKE